MLRNRNWARWITGTQRRIMGGAIDIFVKQRRPGAYLAYRVAERVVRAYTNADANMNSNGERWLQSVVGDELRHVVAVDVGANWGEWISGLVDATESRDVHCYEPVPSTFERLKKVVVAPGVDIHNIALSSAHGSITLETTPANPYVATVAKLGLWDTTVAVSSVTVPAVTGDSELARLKLDSLDMLKVDAEGHDFDVLLGFDETIRHRRVKLIQFEYNMFTQFTGRSLRDFFTLLGKDYLVCRLLPHGLEACGYHHGLENYRQSSWVAVNSEMPNALKARLRIRLAKGIDGVGVVHLPERLTRLLRP